MQEKLNEIYRLLVNYHKNSLLIEKNFNNENIPNNYSYQIIHSKNLEETILKILCEKDLILRYNISNGNRNIIEQNNVYNEYTFILLDELILDLKEELSIQDHKTSDKTINKKGAQDFIDDLKSEILVFHNFIKNKDMKILEKIDGFVDNGFNYYFYKQFKKNKYNIEIQTTVFNNIPKTYLSVSLNSKTILEFEGIPDGEKILLNVTSHDPFSFHNYDYDTILDIIKNRRMRIESLNGNND